MFAKQVVGVGVLVSLLIVGTASGADPKPEERPQQSKFRTWTDITGNFKVMAAFVESKDGKVTLKKEAGSTIAVPIAKLSKEDRAWLASQAPPRPLKEQPSGIKKPKQAEVPEAGAPVEYQGTWLMTNVSVSQAGSEMFAVFRDTEGFLFGFDLNVLPERFAKTPFRDLGRVKGTFKGMKTIKTNEIAVGKPSEIEFREIASPEPIIP